MISAGVEGRLPYMTYPEPWRGPPKQPPELFLRPAPKPLPPTTNRYNNGVNTTTYPNGTRLATNKYPSPPTIANNPVNLAQPKEDLAEDMSPFSPYRLFPPAHQFPHFTYPLCQPSYMMRTAFPMDTASTTFLPPPPSTFSPPAGQSLLRDKKPPPNSAAAAFKVPSGKEGSLKHRILTTSSSSRPEPLDLQKPPPTPNNNTPPGSFARGSLIKLHNGELRRIEDMRTEDFVLSAERSPELRLAESTVVRIEEHKQTGKATLTLTYNNRRAQVDMDSTLEHPYFVMGHGWASCDPERSQQCYGLKVHRLQVGDVLISLTPRESPPQPHPQPHPQQQLHPQQQPQQHQHPQQHTQQHPQPHAPRSVTTVMTTATTTSMTARQLSVNSGAKTLLPEPKVSTHQTQPMNLHMPSSYPPQSMSPDSIAARKRRWSAPDQICDEEEQSNSNSRRHRIE